MKIVDVIEYSGDNSTFIWKHPAKDFNTLSQLVVRETQEVLLFLDGQALDLFPAGRYTLHTKNIPLLNKIVNLPFDGASPFKCEVYFINKTEQMAINWGIGDVNYLDPTNNNYAFEIGACGEMSIKVSDARKLVTKLVGTEVLHPDGTMLDRETVIKYFKAPINTYIKSLLPNILREKGVSIFEVEAYLAELSETLKWRVSEEMSDYGISLEKFWINTILKPEEDPFYIALNRQRGEKITLANQGELDMQRADYQRRVGVIAHSGEVEQRKMDIAAKRFAQEQLGFTYQQERGYDVMEKVAENEGSGSDLRNAAMGIGMGFGVGGAFGDALTNISNSTMSTGMTTPPVPHAAEATGSAPADAFEKKLQRLVMMRDAGVLSEQELAEQKNLLLRQLHEDE